MPICPRCGAQLSPESSPCPNCGAGAVPDGNGEPEMAGHGTRNGATGDARGEQVYLPAQPYIAPSQLYDSHYLHPYVPGRTIYATPSEQAPEIMPGVLGVVPAPLRPENPVQRVLLHIAPNYAADPVVGVLAGGVTAVGMVLLLTLITLFALGPAIAPAVLLPIGGQAGSDAAASVLSTNNIFVILALEHHASFVLRSGANSGIIALTLPVTTLLAIPALSLMAGGYVAASTEYANRWRAVLLRAVAVGPIYGLLLTLITAVFGAASLPGNTVATVSWPTMLAYSVCWGVTFALAGGSAKLLGWRWRAALVALVLRSPRGPVAAALAGAAAAIGIGLLLTTAVGVFAVGYNGTSSQLDAALQHAGGGQSLLPGYLFVLSLPFGVWFQIFATGSTFTTATFALGGHAAPTTTLISIFDVRVPPAYYLAFCLPALAYFCGGHIAARVMRAPTQVMQIITGALTGLFGAILTCLLAGLTGYAFSATTAPGTQTYGIAGPDMLSAFAGALVFGLLFGVLGALVYVPHRRIPIVVWPVALEAVFAWMDRLTWRQQTERRPHARTLLYLAILSGMALAAGSVVLDLLGAVLVRFVTFTALHDFAAAYGGILFGVPALLLISACIADLFSLPEGCESVVEPILAQPPDPPQTAPYEYLINAPTATGMPIIAEQERIAATNGKRMTY